MNYHLTAQVTAGFNEVFGNYSTDALIIIITLALFFAYGFFRGKTRLISLILSLYVASVLFLTFPYTQNISVIRNIANASLWSALLVFAVILIATHFIMNKIVLASESFGTARWIHFALLSLTGLFSVIGLSFTLLPFGHLLTFSATVSRFIHAPLTLFIFLIVPCITIYFVNRY